MPKYENGKIYELINDIDDEIYVGSSCNPLWARFALHKSKIGKRKSKLYIKMETLGKEHFKIILIENYPCKDKNELRSREQYHINLLKPKLNMFDAVLNVERKKVKAHIKYRENYQKNKEVIIERVKQYANENKDLIKERNTTYRKEHKEEIKKRKSIMIHCDVCDIEINKDHKARHERTKAHINNLPKVI